MHRPNSVRPRPPTYPPSTTSHPLEALELWLTFAIQPLCYQEKLFWKQAGLQVTDVGKYSAGSLSSPRSDQE